MSLSLILAALGAVAAAVGSGVLLARCFRAPRGDLIGWSLALLGLLVSLGSQTLGYLVGFDPAMFRAMEIGGQVIAPLAIILALTEVAARSTPVRFCARLYLPALAVVAVVVLQLDQLTDAGFSKAWPDPAAHYQIAPDYVLYALGVVTFLIAVIAVVTVARRASQPAWQGLLRPQLAGGAAAVLLAYPALALLAGNEAGVHLPVSSVFSLLCALAAGLVWLAGVGTSRAAPAARSGPSARASAFSDAGGPEPVPAGAGLYRGEPREAGYERPAHDDYDLYRPGPPRSAAGNLRDRDAAGYDAGGYDADRYDADRYDADRYGPDGYGPDGYGPDGYGPDGYGPDGYGPDGYGPDGYGGDPLGGSYRPSGADGRGYPAGPGDRDGYGGYDPDGNGHRGPARDWDSDAGQHGDDRHPGDDYSTGDIATGDLAAGDFAAGGPRHGGGDLGAGAAALAAPGYATASGWQGASPGRADDWSGDQTGSAERAQLFGQIAIYTLLEDRVEEFDQLAERVVQQVRDREPATLVFILHAVPSAPMQRILYEVYRDRAAYEQHIRQPHVLQFESDRRPYVLATNVIELGLQQAKVSPFPSVSELFGEPGYDTSGFERPDYLRDFGATSDGGRAGRRERR